MDENNKFEYTQEISGEIPAEKPKSKKPLIFGGIALVIIAAVVLFVSLMSTSPLGLVAKGAKNSYEALQGRDYAVLMERVPNGGSMELEVDLSRMDIGMELDAAVKLKYYMDAENSNMALDLDAFWQGMELLDLMLFADKDELALGSQVILGENSYGLNLDQLSEKFNQSIFGPQGAYSIGIDAADIEQYLSGAEDTTALSKELAVHAEGLVKAFGESLLANSESNKEKAQLDFNGELIKAEAVSIVIDQQGAENIVMDTLSYILNNEELKQFFYDNPSYAIMLGDMDSAYIYDFMDMSEEECKAIVDEFYAQLQELIDDREGLREALEGFELELLLYVSKADKYLVGIEANVQADGERVQAKLFVGPDMENVSYASFSYDDGYTQASGEYIVSVNSKNRYSSAVSVNADGEELFTAVFDWNKDGGDFMLAAELADYEQTITLKGQLELSADRMALSFGSISDGEQTMPLGLNYALNAEDAMPAMPRYVDLLEMSQGEFEALVEDIAAVAQELAMMFYQMYYTGF